LRFEAIPGQIVWVKLAEKTLYKMRDCRVVKVEEHLPSRGRP
jgi:hypothetical protein